MRYLRYIREKKELTQDELAALSGVPQNTLSRLERGLRKPRVSTLERLARALDVDDPAMLALNVTSVKTLDEVLDGSKGVREAYLEYRRDTGRLASLVEDLRQIYDAGIQAHPGTTLEGARLQAAYLLGYAQCALEGVAIEEKSEEKEEALTA
jgi:transcriptional regulator with XRE-family HTH domain